MFPGGKANDSVLTAFQQLGSHPKECGVLINRSR